MAKPRTKKHGLYSWRSHGTPFAIGLMFTLLGLALLFPREGWTHNHLGQALPNNCFIRILTEKHSGDRMKLTFKTHLDSKKECKRLAELHTPNFAPDSIARKNVSFRWKTVN